MTSRSIERSKMAGLMLAFQPDKYREVKQRETNEQRQKQAARERLARLLEYGRN